MASNDNGSGCMTMLLFFFGLFFLCHAFAEVKHELYRIEKFLKMPPEAEQNDQ